MDSSGGGGVNGGLIRFRGGSFDGGILITSFHRGDLEVDPAVRDSDVTPTAPGERNEELPAVIEDGAEKGEACIC